MPIRVFKLQIVVCLVFVVGFFIPKAHALTVAVSGNKFTINGSPTFLLGASYFTGLAASSATLDSDFSKLQSKGFKLIRVWGNWDNASEGGAKIELISPSGVVDSGTLTKLKSLLDKANSHGLVVDLTFAFPDFNSFTAYKNGIESLAEKISSYDNVIIDVDNEIGALDPDEASTVKDTIKAKAPSIVVVESRTVNKAADASDALSYAAKLDAADAHCCRDDDRVNTTTEVAGALVGGTDKPVYFSEPDRCKDPRHNKSGSIPSANCQNNSALPDGNKVDEEFLGMAKACKAAGCAAWTFHSAASFFLNDGSLYSGFGYDVERDVFNGLNSALDSVEWGGGDTGGGGDDGGGGGSTGGGTTFISGSASVKVSNMTADTNEIRNACSDNNCSVFQEHRKLFCLTNDSGGMVYVGLRWGCIRGGAGCEKVANNLRVGYTFEGVLDQATFDAGDDATCGTGALGGAKAACIKTTGDTLDVSWTPKTITVKSSCDSQTISLKSGGTPFSFGVSDFDDSCANWPGIGKITGTSKAELQGGIDGVPGDLVSCKPKYKACINFACVDVDEEPEGGQPQDCLDGKPTCSEQANYKTCQNNICTTVIGDCPSGQTCDCSACSNTVPEGCDNDGDGAFSYNNDCLGYPDLRAQCSLCSGGGTDDTTGGSGYGPGWKPVQFAPLAEVKDLGGLIKTLFDWSLTILGFAIFVLFFSAGVWWATAGGNPSRIGQAKKWIQNAIWGALILFSSYLILRTINPDLVGCSSANCILPGLPPAVNVNSPASSGDQYCAIQGGTTCITDVSASDCTNFCEGVDLSDCQVVSKDQCTTFVPTSQVLGDADSCAKSDGTTCISDISSSDCSSFCDGIGLSGCKTVPTDDCQTFVTSDELIK